MLVTSPWGTPLTLLPQRNRTIHRPNTVAEMRQLNFADFSPALRNQWIAGSAASGATSFAAPGVIAVGDASNPGGTVPDVTVPPTSVGGFGRAPFGSTTPGSRATATTTSPPCPGPRAMQR